MKTYWFYFKDWDANGIWRTLSDGIDATCQDDAQEKLQNIYPTAIDFTRDYRGL